ncbi:MAG: hypothetical protein ABEI53_03495 [Candidatus Magasanikbacteria bacterium]
MKSLKSGQIALPFVLLIGGIIVEIVIAGSLISFFVSGQALGQKLSLRALSAAKTGVYDAMTKISFNKEFGAGGKTYTISNAGIGGDTVTVDVSRNVDNSTNSYIYTIKATATARSRERKFVAKVIVDQTTGKVSLSSIKEQPVN